MSTIRLPDDLVRRPFSLDEARAAGPTHRDLGTPRWRRIGPRTYASSSLALSPEVALRAVRLRLPEVAAFSGRTAGWLHGLDVAPCDPIEVVIPEGFGVSGRVGARVTRALVTEAEVVVRRGHRMTSVVRTLADLGRTLPIADALVVVDAALHQRMAGLSELEEWLLAHRSHRGTARLRRVLEWAEPRAESPMETRLRLALLEAGLARPQAQVDLHDAAGRCVARADLYYPEARLAIEYDGATHRDSLTEDNRRQNRLLSAGYRLLRFTAPDLAARDLLVDEVRRALASPRAAAGARP